MLRKILEMLSKDWGRATRDMQANQRVRAKLHYMYNHGDYETQRVVIEILDALNDEK